MKLITAVTTLSLLASIVSCGNHSSNSSNKKSGTDTLVTSADWKIFLEGKSFPNNSMIIIDDEIVVNECADKQSYFIDRDNSPQSLTLQGYKVPQKNTVKIEVFDQGDDCMTESTFLADPQTEYMMSKTGNVAKITISL